MRTENSHQSALQVEKTKSPYRDNHKVQAVNYSKARRRAGETTDEESGMWRAVGEKLNKPPKVEESA